MATVLVVDDAMFIRKLVKIYVQNTELEIAGEAGSGAEVIELYKSLTPEIVAVDLAIPNYDGGRGSRGHSHNRAAGKNIFPSIIACNRQKGTGQQ